MVSTSFELMDLVPGQPRLQILGRMRNCETEDSICRYCRNQMAKTSLLVLVLFLCTAGAMARPDGQFSSVMSGTGFCTTVIEPFTLYNCTEYMVTTFDGFLLALHLIQLIDYSGSQFLGDVLFLHPSLLGGSSWFLASSPTPFAIADAGYSVWIANMRATEFSFGHEQLNPTQTEFWDWDMDEVVNYDVPAFVDFVLSATNGRKLHFVGYSQGARVGLGSISYQTQRASSLASVTLIAPVVFMTNTMSRVLLAMNYTDIAELGYHIGIGKLSFATLEGATQITNIERLQGSHMLVGATQSAENEGLQDMERELLCQFTGPNCCIDPHAAFTALTGPYSFTTFKNLAHLTQSMRNGTFMAYDYGSANSNTRVYQNRIPPTYKLQHVPATLPVLVLYGGNDRLSTPADIQLLISGLSTLPAVLYNPSYAHLDYLFSSAIMQDVNLPILNFIGLHNVVW